MARDFRVIVAGGRKFNDYEALKATLDEWKKSKKLKEDDKVTIVCGCAEGADDLGRKYANEVGFEVKEFPANWNLLGKVAGVLRNKEMAKFASESESGDGVLFAFWNGKSNGTRNMINTAVQYGLSVHIRSYKDPEYNTASIIEEYCGALLQCGSLISEKYKELVSPELATLHKFEELETKGEPANIDIDVQNI